MDLHERHFVIVRENEVGAYERAVEMAIGISKMMGASMVCYDLAEKPGDGVFEFASNSAEYCSKLKEALEQSGYRTEAGVHTVDLDDPFNIN